VNNVVNQVAYLRTSREFPEDLHQLCVESNKSYVSIAQAVNARTIGIFPTDRPAITGESWFLNNQRQQTLRQVYSFSSFTSPQSIPHAINTNSIRGFTRIYGTATNGTNWYPLPYVDVTAANNQINVIVTPTNIVITAGAGAPPAITSGWIVLEWLSQV
jgi:hypothetical protein